ncbi:MAG: serine/threonine protein kinase, partial [Planctomycetales bacterium]|nr:serine/threonine protein kinase [Planctomycetales bacterium]
MPKPDHRELFELASRIDEVCGRFESAWQAGDEPRIENYLSDVIESERADLLRDLLAIELELLTKAGKLSNESSYCSRFPQFGDVIRDVFAASAGHAFFGNLRDYELQQKLGAGSMGVVYKALHTRLKRSVAIKTLPPNSMHRPETVSRFHREMEAIGQLDDPHIVRAHDAGEVDGTHYLVMEYVDGLDLRELQERVGPLSIANACEIVRQAAMGLQSAAKVGLVHRDLKPSNMMLTRSGTVKILDLGLAHISKESDQTAELTSTGQIMGTFDYLAPEQATDTKNIDVRADIYSLGCTLFKLLTGRVPYASEQSRTSYQRIRAHLEEPVPSIAAIRADVPPELEALLMRMLAKQPAERIQSPKELEQQLANFSAGHDLPALMTAAATTFNAELDTASMSGTTFTFASGSVSAEDSEPNEPDTPQHETSITPVTTNVATPVGRTARPSLLSPFDGRGVRPTLVAVILLALSALPIAYFSGLLFTVKTAGGTIVLECDPAALKDAKIEIDGEQVQLKLAGDDQAVTIGVDQRRGKLKITKAGFKVFDTNFEIAVGDNEHAITVRLEPLPDAADRVAAATAWKPGPTDDVIPGLIPRPATFPGIKRWQIETKLPRTIIRCGAYSPDGKRLACGT